MKITLFSQGGGKLVRRVAMFYIFANLFNGWLNRRGLDSHESTFNLLQDHMPSSLWIVHCILMTEWKWKRLKASQCHYENSFHLINFLKGCWDYHILRSSEIVFVLYKIVVLVLLILLQINSKFWFNTWIHWRGNKLDVSNLKTTDHLLKW